MKSSAKPTPLAPVRKPLPVGCEAAPVYRRLPEAAARIPSMRGKPGGTHPDTVKKWIRQGVKLRDGSMLRLEAKRFPGGWGISDEAVERFVDRMTADWAGGEAVVAPAAPKMSAADRKRAAWVNEELDRMGV